MALESVITDTVVTGILILLGMVVVYFIIREFRIMKTSTRAIELDLEKDKIKLLQQHETSKVFSFTRLTPEQNAEIRKVDDGNTDLETTIYAKEKLLETRLTRLEYLVKEKKLDNLMSNIEEKERKVK